MTARRALLFGAILLCALGDMSSLPIPAYTERNDVASLAQPSATQTQVGLTVEIVLEDIPQPTDFAFAPDGRIFIASLSGQVRIAEDGQLLPTPFITLPTNSRFQRGLLGLALDPEFEANGYVYLFYTFENNQADDTGPKTSQLIRVTADGNFAVPGSELVLLGSVVGTESQPSCGDFPVGADCLPADGRSHVGGSIAFGTDGTLFVGTGEASFSAPNEGELQIAAQNLDSLAGKVLRINRDGSAPPDNPFFTGDPNANRSKIWAYGLRNPFRLSLQPGTNVPFVGDVGSGFWEEINAVQPGINLGWPCYEGANRVNSKLAFCENMYRDGTNFTHPAYTSGRPNTLGTAIVAGVFYEGDDYPPRFQNAFFFGDWVQHTISVLKFDTSNEVIDGTVTELFRRPDAGAPVDFELHPDGDVYYLNWPFDPPDPTLGDLRRIRFVAGNQAPVVSASFKPAGGLAPLDVQFSSDGSFDPDGGAMLFSWNFGDGTSSSDANPKHTFVEDGRYDVSLFVVDPEGGRSGTEVRVVVGSEAPVATITTPLEGEPYTVGETVSFSGSASDPEDGTLSSESLEWTIDLRHCQGSNSTRCHTHGFFERAGDEGEFVGPDPAGDIYFLQLNLTATDSTGLTDTTSILIGPNEAPVAIEAGGTSSFAWVLAIVGVLAVFVVIVAVVILMRRNINDSRS